MMIKKVFATCLAVVFVSSYGLAAPPIPVLGQVIASNVSVDNMQVPSGTTLLGRTLVATSQEPAFVHLSSGQSIQLHRNSKAYIEKGPADVIQVSVRSGTLSYRTADGLATATPASTVVFAPEVLPTSIPEHQGVKVVLVREAQAGANTIRVNDVSQLDSQMELLIKSPDGRMQEVHRVESFDGDNVILMASLGNSFPTSSTAGSSPTAGSSALPPTAFGFEGGVGTIVLVSVVGLTVGTLAKAALSDDVHTPKVTSP